MMGVITKVIRRDYNEELIEGYIHENGGGFVAKTAIVKDSVFVDSGSIVLDYARVTGKVVLQGKVSVEGHAVIEGRCYVCGKALVSDYVYVSDRVCITDEARVCGHALVSGNAIVADHAEVRDYAMVFGDALICDTACICQNARVRDFACVTGDSHVKGTVTITGNAKIWVNLPSDNPNDRSGATFSFGSFTATINGDQVSIGCGNLKIVDSLKATKKYAITRGLPEWAFDAYHSWLSWAYAEQVAAGIIKTN